MAANKAADEKSFSVRTRSLGEELCGKHIAHERAFVNDRISMVVQILRRLQGE